MPSHIALRVPDLESSVAGAEEVLGLREVERRGRTSYLAASGDRHHEFMLVEGDELAVDHIAFEAHDAAEYLAISDLLRRDGVALLPQENKEIGVANSLRCLGPMGFVFELVDGMSKTSSAAADRDSRPVPRGLDHITLAAPDIKPLETFLVNYFGLVCSDRQGDAMSWLRGVTHHHVANLVTSDKTGLHHHGWRVDGLTEIGRYADHLAKLSRSLLWGPGRHSPGSLLFGYFQDVDGLITECCARDQAEGSDDDESRDWPAGPATGNCWGTPSPPGFRSLVVPVGSAPVSEAAIRP